MDGRPGCTGKAGRAQRREFRSRVGRGADERGGHNGGGTHRRQNDEGEAELLVVAARPERLVDRRGVGWMIEQLEVSVLLAEPARPRSLWERLFGWER